MIKTCQEKEKEFRDERCMHVSTEMPREDPSVAIGIIASPELVQEALR